MIIAFNSLTLKCCGTIIPHLSNMSATMNVAGLLAVIFVAAAVVNAGGKTLVLVDNWSIRETHSNFFRSLRGEHRHNGDISR